MPVSRYVSTFVVGLALAAALAMSGCGGGGSGTTTPAPDTTTPAPSSFTLPGDGLTASQQQNIRAAAVKAAGNAPSSGSVTQSSNGDGATADSVSVRVSRDANGAITWTVSEDGGWSVNRDNAGVLAEPSGDGWKGIEFHQTPDGGKGDGTGPGLYVDVYTDIAAPTTRTVPVSGNDGTVTVPPNTRVLSGNVNITTRNYTASGTFNDQPGSLRCTGGCEVSSGRVTAGTWSFTPDRPPGAQDVPGNAAGVVFTGTFDTSGTAGTLNGRAGSFRCLSRLTSGCGQRTSNGRLTALTGDWIFVPSGGTTTQTVQDADYLAGGIWVRVPEDAASVADYEFGAFVDGNDPFTQANLAGLTGTATYVAKEGATAVYSHQGTNRNYFVDGDVRLTADFGDASSLGSISGTISNITGEGPASDSYDGVRVMLERAQIGSANSGFFTGNTSTEGTDSPFTGKWGGQFYGNGAAGAPPGSVAGTFGGATADGSESFVGVYGAHRQQQ